MEKSLEIILEKVGNGDFLDVINKANSFFGDLFNGHSEYQIKNFILNDQDFPLSDDKYYQAMREGYVRYEELLNMSFQLRKVEDEIELLNIDLEELQKKNDDENDFNIRRNEVRKKMIADNILQLVLGKDNIKKRLESTLREMKIFVDVVDILKGVKKYDNYEEKEKESWDAKAKSIGKSLPTSSLQFLEKQAESKKIESFKAVE